MTISIKDWKQLSDSEQKNAVKEVLTPHREEWIDKDELSRELWDEVPTTSMPDYSEIVALGATILPEMESDGIVEHRMVDGVYEYRLTMRYWKCTFIYVQGTFNRFHDGHRALLDKAIEAIESIEGPSEIVLCVTSDELAAKKYGMIPVRPVSQRIGDPSDYIIERTGRRPDFIVENEPDEAIAQATGADYLICSEMSEPECDVAPNVVSIPMVEDEIGILSSTRIIRQERIREILDREDSGIGTSVVISDEEPMAVIRRGSTVILTDGISEIPMSIVDARRVGNAILLTRMV